MQRDPLQPDDHRQQRFPLHQQLFFTAFLTSMRCIRAEVIVAIGGEKGTVSLWDVKTGRAKISNTRIDESAVDGQTITALMYAPIILNDRSTLAYR